jgi:hypothetical protein
MLVGHLCVEGAATVAVHRDADGECHSFFVLVSKAFGAVAAVARAPKAFIDSGAASYVSLTPPITSSAIWTKSLLIAKPPQLSGLDGCARLFSLPPVATSSRFV